MKLFDQRTDRYAARKAKQYAEEGGQALHLWQPTGPFMKKAPAAFKKDKNNKLWGHLMDRNTKRLKKDVRKFGVKKILIGREGRSGQHIDLCGIPLKRAIEACEPDETESSSTE